MPADVTKPSLLVEPGYLFIAPLGSTEPTNTVAGSVFTDEWPAAWLPLGATAEGSTFNFASELEAMSVAEFRYPIAYATTSQEGSFAFALANWSLTNYRRALNGGTAALTPTSGTGATALYTLEPPVPGEETRVMVGWESLDNTVRLVLRQAIQGGEIESAFAEAPDFATIPCTFQIEAPSSGAKPFVFFGAGATRG